MNKGFGMVVTVIAMFVAHVTFGASPSLQPSSKPAGKATLAAPVAQPKPVGTSGALQAPKVVPQAPAVQKVEMPAIKQTVAKDNFAKIYGVVKIHFGKFGIPLDNKKLAEIVLHDIGFVIDSVANGYGWTASMDTNQIRTDVNAMTKGWSKAELNIAGHGLAMTGLLGNRAWTVLGNDALMPLAMGLKQAVDLSNLKQYLDETLKKEVKGYDGVLNAPNTSLPGGGVPAPPDPPSNAIDKAIAALEGATGYKISGNFCGRGWQNDAVTNQMGTTAIGMGMGNDSASTSSDGGGGEGGSGGDGMWSAGGKMALPGGGYTASILCGGGQGGVMDTPAQTNAKAKELYEKAGEASKRATGWAELLDASNEGAGTTKAQKDANALAGKANEVLAEATKVAGEAFQQAANSGKDRPAGAKPPTASEKSALKKDVEALEGAVKELEAKTSALPPGDSGPSGEEGYRPICAGAAMGAAAYCGVGGSYAVMKYVYKEDVWDDLAGPMGIEAYCNGVAKKGGIMEKAVTGQKKCECKVEDGVMSCKPNAKAPAWAVDRHLLYLPTFVVDPSPEIGNGFGDEGTMSNEGGQSQ